MKKFQASDFPDVDKELIEDFESTIAKVLEGGRQFIFISLSSGIITVPEKQKKTHIVRTGHSLFKTKMKPDNADETEFQSDLNKCPVK